MVGSNVRAQALALMDKRAAVEAEIAAITEKLTRLGPGLSGNLLDKDGFPRADIDIPAVRADRQRLAVLHTDHKQLTGEIERCLHELLPPESLEPQGASHMQAERAPPRQAPASVFQEVSQGGARVAVVPVPSRPPPAAPFAVIDEVSEGSPAAADGLRVGDRFLRFGSVRAGGGGDYVRQVAHELQSSEGREVGVWVLRQGAELELRVTPRPWGGRGLLGCHMQPL